MLLLLSCLYFILETKSEEADATLYSLKGRSVCLDVREKPPHEFAKWSYGEKRIASATDINPTYKRRSHYYSSNSTLCLKHLTLKDSGIYTFSFELNYTHAKETYNLIVQEAVPKPALSITVLYSNSSLDLCTVAVNCSVRNDWLWSVCDEDGCQASNKSFSKVNISISNKERRVICTGNNHVSATEASRDAEDICFSSGRKESAKSYLLIVILIGILIISFIFLVFFFVVKKLKSSGYNPNQPLVLQSQPLEEPQPQSRVSSRQTEDSCQNSDALYTNQTRSRDFSPNRDEQSQKTETIYCVLEAPAAAASKGSVCEEKPPQEALNSEMDHNTVYSVLQNPHSLSPQRHLQVTPQNNTENP